LGHYALLLLLQLLLDSLSKISIVLPLRPILALSTHKHLASQLAQLGVSRNYTVGNPIEELPRVLKLQELQHLSFLLVFVEVVLGCGDIFGDLIILLALPQATNSIHPSTGFNN